MSRSILRTTTALATAMLVATACGDRAENRTTIGDSAAASTTSSGTLAADDIDVENIDLGRAVGTDGKISDKTDEFRTTDEIIAVVETDDNAAGKELLARWTYGDADQLVSEQRETVAAGEDARTTFRLTKTSPWPTGKYHLRIMHNGREVKNHDFEVK